MNHEERKVIADRLNQFQYKLEAMGNDIEFLRQHLAPYLEETPKAEPPKTSNFVFGATSKKELVGVRKELVDLAYGALAITTQDFMVFDGLRTIEEQKSYVASGSSQTMNSKHLTGDAVDLVPWINGKPTWDWNGCYAVAHAVYKAAGELGILSHIVWGGCWDKTLAQYTVPMMPAGMKKASDSYAARRKELGKTAFLDGPHFEWKD